MLTKANESGFMTHMPFLAQGAEGERVLFFCRADESRIWKAHYIEGNGEVRRLDTRMPEEVFECSPTAWRDESGWHVSFSAGGAPENPKYRLYRMDGPALDRLSPPVAIQAARTGFIYRERLVWGELENLIHVHDALGDREIELPGANILRVSYVGNAPERLLVSGQWVMDSEVFTLEYNLTSGHQHFIECDGVPAYKCAILGDEILYAERCGDHFEERRLRRAEATILPPANAALRRAPGEVAATSTVPTRKCGCGRPAQGDAGVIATRPSCLECVEKHLGAAYVLLAETRDGYAHRLRAVGHLHEAEDESQTWPALHDAIRNARKAYQAAGAMPDWDALETELGKARDHAE
jgi:hypothetical protein